MNDSKPLSHSLRVGRMAVDEALFKQIKGYMLIAQRIYVKEYCQL